MLQEYEPHPEFTFQIPQPLMDKLDVLFFKKGQIIFSEGSTPLGAFILQNGKVKISKIGSQGKEQIIRIITKNEFFSHIDLFTYSKYSTSAKALEDSYLLFISTQDFWKLLWDQNYLFEKFLHRISLDVKYLEKKVVDLAYMPVRGRLAGALLDLDEKFNLNNDSFHIVLITRTDLACYVGTVNETVNRLLSEFRREQLISTIGTRIHLLDIQRLKNICNMYK